MYAATPRLTCGDLRYFFRNHTVFLEQPQLCGAANCVGARAAIKVGEDVGNMHLHGARAEDKRVSNLTIGLPLRHELKNLPLAAGEVAGA